jgi:hypothetical protein
LALRSRRRAWHTAISSGKPVCRRYIQRFPNGVTYPDQIWVPLTEHIGQVEGTGGTETS